MKPREDRNKLALATRNVVTLEQQRFISSPRVGASTHLRTLAIGLCVPARFSPPLACLRCVWFLWLLALLGRGPLRAGGTLFHLCLCEMSVDICLRLQFVNEQAHTQFWKHVTNKSNDGVSPLTVVRREG